MVLILAINTKVALTLESRLPLKSLHKIPKLHLISWCGSIMKMSSIQPQKVRQNFDILRSEYGDMIKTLDQEISKHNMNT